VFQTSVSAFVLEMLLHTLGRVGAQTPRGEGLDVVFRVLNMPAQHHRFITVSI
jgi:hypothetical protein